MVDETNFILVTIINRNTETEQVTTLLDLDRMVETIKGFSDKHIVLAGDFNFFRYIPRFVRRQTNSEKEIYSQIYRTCRKV